MPLDIATLNLYICDWVKISPAFPNSSGASVEVSKIMGSASSLIGNYSNKNAIKSDLDSAILSKQMSFVMINYLK